MGLQGQLNDMSDSIPLLFVALIANCIGNLRSLLFAVLRSARLARFQPEQSGGDDELFASIGSGFSNLIVLAEQLNLNRMFSHRFGGGADDDAIGASPECVVCLSSLREGESVRRLACRHVFHKDCFDGWLDQLKFSCPLCRSPLVSDERVASAGRRVGRDLVTWFALR